MITVNETLASQYANSPVLLQLLQDMDEFISPSVNLDAFFNQIWNVQTASGYGLDVWGRIVGVNRVVHITTGQLYFGFAEAADVPLTNAQPFDQAPFFDGSVVNDNYSLSDSAFRQLIFVKALSNITDCSIPSINQILRNLFGQLGDAYCTDLGNMQMTYTFNFVISPVDYAIITESGAMPKPAGVYATVIQL